MDETIVKQAEDWLLDILELEKGDYRKDPMILYLRIAKEIRLYSPKLQSAIFTVLRNWLAEDNGAHVGTAVTLIHLTRATEFIPALQQLLDDVLSGRRSVEYASTVQNIIDVLEKERRK